MIKSLGTPSYGEFQTLAQWKSERALLLKSKLDNGVLTKPEVEWLYDETGCTRYLASVQHMCDMLINAYILEQVTAVITS